MDWSAVEPEGEGNGLLASPACNRKRQLQRGCADFFSGSAAILSYAITRSTLSEASALGPLATFTTSALVAFWAQPGIRSFRCGLRPLAPQPAGSCHSHRCNALHQRCGCTGTARRYQAIAGQDFG